MKTYHVTTQTMVNESNLFSMPRTGEFTTTDLDEAKKIYTQEVKALEEELTRIDNLSYIPTDDEMNHAFFTNLWWRDDDEDVEGTDDEVGDVLTSDYYFEEA